MIPGFGEAITLIARTAGAFILFYLPALAAAAAVLKLGCKSRLLAGLIALAATGIYGDLVFWVWFLWPHVGRFVTLLIPVLCLFCFVYFMWHLDASARSILRTLLVPIVLSGAFSLFVLSIGFVYGGLDRPLQTASIRFSHQLPGDNYIPLQFAEAVRNQYIPKPLQADWHSSDRPPLQAGLVLAQTRYFSHRRDLSAEITGVIAQSTWILALWIFLIALEVEPRVIVLILAAGLTSGFVLVNTFFVWPKLLAAAYTLGALSLLWITKTKWTAALCGVLIALALLSHGGAVFAFVGAIPMLLLPRMRIQIKHAAILVATAFLLYLPWGLYQKFYDPPGDRLLKMHLAGIENVDPRPFGQALIQAYERKSFHDICEYKWSNWITATDHNTEYWQMLDKFLTRGTNQLAGSLRAMQFFYFVPSLGFLALGIPALLLGILPRFRTTYWHKAAMLSLFVLIVIVIWCLVMFGPATTIIHQGAYAIVLLAYAACCLSLWSVFPALAKIAVALQGVLDFLLYGPFMEKSMGQGRYVPFGDVHVGMIVTAASAALVAAAMFYKISRNRANERK